jgi:voltage-gated potassium channel
MGGTLFYNPRGMFKGSRLAIALFAAVVIAATVGFRITEGWSWWHAFHAAVLAISTVEAPPMSPAGQALTLVVLVAGIGAGLFTFTTLASIVVDGGLPKLLRRRREARMLDTIKDHFIICGYGRIGRMVSQEFRRQDIPCVVIERNGERMQVALADGAMAVEADASDERVLERVGIRRARGLVAAVGTDAENVYAVMTARTLRADLFIVGRAESEDATRKLRTAGADRVISPYQIGAAHMAQTAVRPAVVDFMQLATGTDNLELSMEQITIAPHSHLVDKSLLSATLRQRFGVVVIGIQRKDRRMEFNPEPDAVLRADDKLVVLGRTDSLKDLASEASPQ